MHDSLSLWRLSTWLSYHIRETGDGGASSLELIGGAESASLIAIYFLSLSVLSTE
jgi:hypothetical protein